MLIIKMYIYYLQSIWKGDNTKGFFKNMDNEKYIKMQYRGFVEKNWI